MLDSIGKRVSIYQPEQPGLIDQNALPIEIEHGADDGNRQFP